MTSSSSISRPRAKPKRAKGSTDTERFKSMVEVRGPQDCWMWKGSRTKSGYGNFTCGFPRKPINAHRWLWEHLYGPIPKGKLVCHSCDTPACANPAHLFLGTVKDNMDDMTLKRRGVRSKKGLPYGVAERRTRTGRVVFQAQVKHRGRMIHLGSYTDQETASRVSRESKLQMIAAEKGSR